MYNSSLREKTWIDFAIDKLDRDKTIVRLLQVM